MASLTKTIQKPLDVMRRLEKQIRELESLQRAHAGVVSSGCPPMDAFLPLGGYSRGSLTEFVSDQGMALGLTTMALQIAKNACTDGKYLVLIDSEQQLFPQALNQLGIPIDRLICLRPNNYADFIWGLDQTLRNGSVGAVIASIERMDDRTARRIQLAAEAGGGLGLLLRSLDSVRRYASWAEVQWLVYASSPGPEARWFDLILRRAPGWHSASEHDCHTANQPTSNLASFFPKGRVGKQLRLGIDAMGQWTSPQVSASSVNRTTPVFNSSTPVSMSGLYVKREARNEQTDHVRVAAELASPTRHRRSLAG